MVLPSRWQIIYEWNTPRSRGRDLNHRNNIKCLSYCRKGQRSAEDMRREDFLGPLFNGDPEGRRRIGLYLLRTIGTVLRSNLLLS